MKTLPPTPSTHLCPLCGQPNQCAMHARHEGAVGQEPCWCTEEKIGANLLQRIPEQARGKACVCAACVHAAAH